MNNCCITSFTATILKYLSACSLANLSPYVTIDPSFPAPWHNAYPTPYLLHGAVLLEKLTGLHLVKKFPTIHRTRRFITALTSIRHPSLSWASQIQSIYPHPTSWRSVIILSTHLCLGLPSSLFPSSFPTKSLHTHPSPHTYALHA